MQIKLNYQIKYYRSCSAIELTLLPVEDDNSIYSTLGKAKTALRKIIREDSMRAIVREYALYELRDLDDSKLLENYLSENAGTEGELLRGMEVRTGKETSITIKY